MLNVNYVSGAEIDLTFPGNTDINTIFRAIADVADINLIVGSEVEGEMSIRLSGLNAMEAIGSVASGHGLDYYYDRDANVVFVDKAEKIEERFYVMDREVKVFKLENSDPKEVMDSISFLVADDLIDINERKNSIIVSAYKDDLEELEKLIISLDEGKKQVVIQARIQTVNRSQRDNLGIDWSILSGEGDSVRYDSPSKLELNLFDSFDSFELDRFMINLNMLEETGNSELLANPRISTIDGQQAKIHMGDQIPVLVPSSESNQPPSLTFEEAGITLDIKPRIVENNQIEIDVHPQISSVTEYVNLGQYQYPVIDSTEAETTIRVTDGKTAVIGGLIQDEVFFVEGKIPVLGNVPLLGRFFKNENKRIEKQELLIFITPKIIEKDEAEKEVDDSRWERRVDEVLERFMEDELQDQ